MTHYFLSDSDRQWLLDLALEVFSRVKGNTSSRPETPPLDYPAPDVYMVLTPDDGIPPAVAGVLGTALCPIYRKDPTTGEMVAIDTDLQVVNNIQSFAVPGGFITICHKDKHGDWYAGGAILDSPDAVSTSLVWAQVDLGTSPYTWHEVKDDGAGHWSIRSGGRSGILDLYEVNGRVVPAGERVLIWKSADSEKWNFWYNTSSLTSQTVTWVSNTFNLTTNTWNVTEDTYNYATSVFIFNGGSITYGSTTAVAVTINKGTWTWANTTINVYQSGSTVTYQSGATVNNQTSNTYSSTYVGTFQSGSSTTYQSGSTVTYSSGSTTVFAGTVNITGGTWTISGSTSFSWTSTGLFIWSKGGMEFGSTSSASVAVLGFLCLPQFNFSGKPTYTGIPGEVACQDLYSWQWNDTADVWEPDIPWDTATWPPPTYSIPYIDSNGREFPLPPGTDTYVLTMVSGVPTWQAPASGSALVKGQSALTSDYTVTNSYADSGLGVTLPTSGKTYRITAVLPGEVNVTIAANMRLQAKLRDTTAGADVSNAKITWCTAQVAGLNAYETGHMEIDFTAPANNTVVKVYAQYSGTGSAATTKLLGNSTDGYCVLSYLQLD